MAERFPLHESEYVMFSDMIDRLRDRFPDVDRWRLEQIVNAEHEAITGGVLHIVPAEVEAGAIEILMRERRDTDGEASR